jgi:diguanylate cyclase (GGDEF)-like protein/PAS domain S-box-containing protein
MAKEFILELIDNMDDGIYLVDKDRRITYWNKSAERITGFTSDDVVGKRCCDNILIHIDENGENQCQAKCPLFDVIDTGERFERELYLHHKNGHRLPVSVKVIPMKNAQDEITGAVEIFNDNSFKIDSLEEIEELKKLILFDQLTESGNRTYVEMNLHTRFAELSRYKIPFGLLFVDIDNFKNVNDKHGHDIGDKVLRMTAKTMMKNLRPFDIVGRWGGEEFVVVVLNVNEEQLKNVANKLKLFVDRSVIVLNETIVHVTVSIGATIARTLDTQETLIKRADKLMYESKRKGKNIITLG